MWQRKRCSSLYINFVSGSLFGPVLPFITNRKLRTSNSALVELITLLSQSRVCERWQIAFVAVNDPKAKVEAPRSDIALSPVTRKQSVSPDYAAATLSGDLKKRGAPIGVYPKPLTIHELYPLSLTVAS